MMAEVLAAGIGTVAFALLFSVPSKHYVNCGLIGAVGYWLYYLLVHFGSCSATVATFFATVLVVLLSRFAAVQKRCPVTVFMITGIFLLVPGAGIYWTTYYLVTSQAGAAATSGAAAAKATVAIVLGIVVVFELPNHFFALTHGGPSNRHRLFRHEDH